ncbi:ribonuclease P protein component [Oenococcus kitaharae]|uniref:Ribonuclease P protein component n=1 Tax=Oenococcus kitaharae DSM 17330 TaxID=1045004 RepID=G9WF01_9LACO|nr:ribonuclease P protein component [Oenococcus kitaharae]EHN58561.1 Ribonuclease P protein component [Oenococcus kitaharae DSM 17330]MCV3296213.1 ribonuclease P protein component [Oenococcus kitaharae]OEY84725.1 ribonuclease P [Oenococcus kitaharae]OEY85008.1 ribonuclease P [Oenococcus kitaharae]OEY85799.1 ribonuclease P [Oenococcus kitaharae]
MSTKKIFRIKKASDFAKVFAKHQSFANRYFVVYSEQQPENLHLNHWRIGLSVSKKIGKAHERVWVKRRISESFNNLSQMIADDLDIVVVARPAVSGQAQTVIQDQIKHVLDLAGILHDK